MTPYSMNSSQGARMLPQSVRTPANPCYGLVEPSNCYCDTLASKRTAQSDQGVRMKASISRSDRSTEGGGKNMRRTGIATGMAIAVGLFLIAGATALRAEDSGVFKNGASILQAQQILVEDGYLSPGSYISGVTDEATRKALTQYQSAHAPNSNGILDDETFRSLTSYEIDYPWGEGAEVAEAEPVVVESAEVVQVAEAAPAPEPTPAPVVNEAPA